jgi:hypothetical protein
MPVRCWGEAFRMVPCSCQRFHVQCRGLRWQPAAANAWPLPGSAKRGLRVGVPVIVLARRFFLETKVGVGLCPTLGSCARVTTASVILNLLLCGRGEDGIVESFWEGWRGGGRRGPQSRRGWRGRTVNCSTFQLIAIPQAPDGGASEQLKC